MAPLAFHLQIAVQVHNMKNEPKTDENVSNLRGLKTAAHFKDAREYLTSKLKVDCFIIPNIFFYSIHQGMKRVKISEQQLSVHLWELSNIPDWWQEVAGWDKCMLPFRWEPRWRKMLLIKHLYMMQMPYLCVFLWSQPMGNWTKGYLIVQHGLPNITAWERVTSWGTGWVVSMPVLHLVWCWCGFKSAANHPGFFSHCWVA